MYYSQYGQDEYIYLTWFKNRKDGFFVDIGAHDGISLSNSLFFESLGWKGICVEPNPDVYEKLIQNRKCICVNAAVSDKKDNLPFYKLTGSSEMLSGLANEYHRKHLKRVEKSVKKNNDEAEIIYVDTISFLDLPEIEIGTNINYLSIDTEGNELKIIQSIPFEKINVSVISVENNFKDKKIKKHLTLNGFELVKKLKCDEIYVNKNMVV